MKSSSRAKSSRHAPATADELTEQNVRSISELERISNRNVSASDRFAGAITRFCGSMTFVWVHTAWFAIWIVWNVAAKGFDPFPFNLLTLVVSLEAIFLSTFILISENRQGRIDERRSHLDLQINLLSEQENTKMLHLLKLIAEKLQVDTSGDPSFAVLEEATRPETLVKQIDAITQEREKTQ